MKKMAIVMTVLYSLIIVSAVVYVNLFPGLIEAARLGNVKKLEEQLSQDKNKDMVHQALYSAIDCNQVEAVKFIVNRLANNESEFNPLKAAVISCNKEIVDALIDMGFVNKSYSSGNSPLSLAILNLEFDIAKTLLENGANPNIGDVVFPHFSSIEDNLSDMSRLSELNALKRETAEIIKILIEKGADVKGKFGESALLSAASMKNYKLLDYIIDKGADIHLNYVMASIVSIGDLNLIEYFLDNGADVKGDYGSQALKNSVYCENADIMIKYLLDRGASFGEIDIKSMGIQYLLGKKEVIGLLLENGLDANIAYKDLDGRTLLFEAVNKCDVDLVKLLLDHGASTGMKDEHGSTVFDALDSVRTNRIDWFDFGHKRDCDQIYKMLRGANDR